VAVELRGGDVVLSKGSWGCGEARVALPTVRPKAAAGEKRRGGAPVSERGKGMAGELCEDDV
jgi:hypothetical protein